MSGFADKLTARVATDAMGAEVVIETSAAPPSATRTLRIILSIVAAGAFMAGLYTALPLLSASSPPTGRDAAQLETLIRFMAGIKFFMASGFLALVFWRFSQRISPVLAVAYVASVSLMLSGPALVWSVKGVWTGAVLFHSGFLIMIVAVLRDGALLRLPVRAR